MLKRVDRHDLPEVFIVSMNPEVYGDSPRREKGNENEGNEQVQRKGKATV